MAEQPKGFIPLPEIPEKVESASHAYSVAFELARAGDVLGWRQLIKRIKPGIFDALVQWRENELDGQRTTNNEELVKVVNKAVEIISPLISVALVGVESGREPFRDQKATLYDLLNIPGWSSAGYSLWINIPHALGYVYHSLHGSLCLNTNQLDLALDLARSKISVADGITHSPVWKNSVLMGWAHSLGGRCTDGWVYLAKAYEEWEQWLSPIFGTKLEYRTSLVAYYMALNIHELATVIASGKQDTLNTNSNPHFHIPLIFLCESGEINQRAIALLLRNQESLMEQLWTHLKVSREQIAYSWGDWIRSSELWLQAVYGPAFHPRTHLNLTDIFQKLFEAF